MGGARKSEMELVIDRLNFYRDSERQPPDALIDRYRELAEGSRGEGEQAWGLYFQAMKLYSSDRFCEAITVLERALRRFSGNLNLQQTWTSLLPQIAKEVEALARLEPESPELGRTYEKLLEFGTVPIQLHFSMIEHYQLSGSIDRAVDIALKLYGVAPNFPGLTDALALLARDTDDARLLAILAGQGGTERSRYE